MATIIGTIGDDDLTGTTGDDAIYGYDPADQANTDGGNDTLSGADGNDSLFGGNGRDHLSGGAGNDILDGGPGGDVMAGGAGDDVYYASWNYYPDQRDVVEEALNGGIDTIVAATGYVLPANVENLTLAEGVGGGTGNELDNIIIGNSGNNTLSGGSGGLDTLIGGAGDDFYEITSSTTTVVEDAGGGEDRVYIYVNDDYVLPAFVEQGTVGNDASIGLSGNELANTLRADVGNQRLYGLGGDDCLAGGQGDDVLVGGQGDDRLAGGAGTNDTADYSSAAGPIFLNVEAGFVTGAAGRDQLSMVEHVIGTAFDDVLVGYGLQARLDGGAGNDTLTSNNSVPEGGGWTNNFNVMNGGAGDDSIDAGIGADTLIGGAGNDVMDGGKGNDTADYSEATTGVKVDLALVVAQSTGNGTGIDRLSNIENLTGGTVGDQLSGNGVVNVIMGLNGADVLYGRGGNDTLDGGNSADILRGNDGDDRLVGGQGNDRLEGSTGDDVLIGDGNDDLLIGGDGIDTADYAGDGRAVTVNLSITGAQNTGYGADTLSGIERVIAGAGDDRLVGSTAADELHGGAGDDIVSGIGGADSLFGEAGDDQIAGGGGNDRLVGGAGADELLGGADADSFVFTAIAETPIGIARDTIDDFQQGTDHIDLSAIDANVLASGDQAFTFIGASAFTHAGAQLRQTGDGAGNTVIEGDVQGDGVADFQILLKGAYALNSSSFNL